MTESTGPTAEGKRRSVGFPQLDLQEAIDAVVMAGQNGPDHTQDAFAAYLGHQTANSGAFRNKLAALRDWGLIERSTKERVVLTQLAQEFVLAAPEHYKEKRLLLTAFKSCRIFDMLYQDSAKSLPIDTARIRSASLMRYGVTSDNADRFVDSFVKSAVFAGLADFDGTKVTLRPREDAASNSNDSTATAAKVDFATLFNATGSANSPVDGPLAQTAKVQPPAALQQSWDIDGGEIEFIIRTPKPLPPEIYALVAEMATRAKKMVELLSPTEAAQSPAGLREEHGITEAPN